MNVIFVTAQFPYPPRSGITMRVYQLVKQVARRHNVTLLSYADSTHQDGLMQLRDQLPVVVTERRLRTGMAKRSDQLRSIASMTPFTSREAYSQALQRTLNELCVTTACDVVHIEGMVLGGLAIPQGVRLILDEPDVAYEVYQRMCESERSTIRRLYNRWEYERVRRFEQRLWKRVDACVVTSDRDGPIVESVAPGTVSGVVPNAVDLEYFLPSSGDAIEPNSVVFNGTLGYRPNVDAAFHLVDDIWPLVLERCPDAKLTIVGRASDADRRALTRPGVLVTGEVPDIRPYVERAALVAVPVRMGGGTRLKVVEGMAMGKAMVSTTLGCEGLAVRDSEHLLIGDGAHQFATRILDCFADSELRGRLGAAGRRLTEEEYSWDLAGERLEALYQRVVGVGGVRLNQLVGSTDYGGGEAAIITIRRASEVFNVCFHGIGTPERAMEVDEEQYWVEVDQFEEMIEVIARYPFIRITFDDGNASDVIYALPALLRHNLSATFFVVAARIDTPGSLSSEDVRALVRSGMRIGAHGLAHRPWRSLDDDALEAEMHAADTIAELARVPVREAACPFGSYDRRVLTVLRRHAFSRVYTVDGGHARRNAWLQPRYTVRR